MCTPNSPVTKPYVISKKKKHLSSVLVSNGYPLSFLQENHQEQKNDEHQYCTEPMIEYKSTAVLPYVKDLSKQLCCCLQQDIWAVFQLRDYIKITSSTTERRCSAGIPRNPCECGKVYISERGRPMQDRIREHERDI